MPKNQDRDREQEREQKRERVIREFAALTAQRQDDGDIKKVLMKKYELKQEELDRMMEGQPRYQPIAGLAPQPGQLGFGKPKSNIQGADAPSGE